MWGAMMTTESRKHPAWYVLQRLGKKKANRYVNVGILSSDFKNPKIDGDGTEPITLGEVAVIQEFGDGKIPERSFLRSTFRKNRRDWRRFAFDQIREVLRGNITEEQMLNRLGLKIQADIRGTIVAGINPPLSPITIELRKKKRGTASTKPLVDTGQLLNSINYEVVIKAG